MFYKKIVISFLLIVVSFFSFSVKAAESFSATKSFVEFEILENNKTKEAGKISVDQIKNMKTFLRKKSLEITDQYHLAGFTLAYVEKISYSKEKNKIIINVINPVIVKIHIYGTVNVKLKSQIMILKNEIYNKQKIDSYLEQLLTKHHLRKINANIKNSTKKEEIEIDVLVKTNYPVYFTGNLDYNPNDGLIPQIKVEYSKNSVIVALSSELGFLKNDITKVNGKVLVAYKNIFLQSKAGYNYEQYGADNFENVYYLIQSGYRFKFKGILATMLLYKCDMLQNYDDGSRNYEGAVEATYFYDARRYKLGNKRGGDYFLYGKIGYASLSNSLVAVYRADLQYNLNLGKGFYWTPGLYLYGNYPNKLFFNEHLGRGPLIGCAAPKNPTNMWYVAQSNFGVEIYPDIADFEIILRGGTYCSEKKWFYEFDFGAQIYFTMKNFKLRVGYALDAFHLRNLGNFNFGIEGVY